jgi:hypothetical protein
MAFPEPIILSKWQWEEKGYWLCTAFRSSAACSCITALSPATEEVARMGRACLFDTQKGRATESSSFPDMDHSGVPICYNFLVLEM